MTIAEFHRELLDDGRSDAPSDRPQRGAAVPMTRTPEAYPPTMVGVAWDEAPQSERRGALLRTLLIVLVLHGVATVAAACWCAGEVRMLRSMIETRHRAEESR